MSIIRDVTIKSKKYLISDEVIIFVGARQAGKTTILKQIKADLEVKGEICYFLNLEDPEYLELLNKNPKNIFKIFSMDLERKIFIFIDEIQYLRDPSNFLKYIYDEYKEKIKLIVSGSSAFYIDRKFKDSLAGRKKIFNVSTLSFREFLRFKNEESLSQKDFFALSLEEENKTNLYFREFMIYGGYPRVVLSPREEKEDIIREMAYSYIKKDIYEANIKQEESFYKLFKILSSQVGSLVNTSELANTLGISKTAIANYLYVMQKSFHICLVKPFFKNTRKEITKMPKVFFMDLGLRNFFAGDFNSFETRGDKGSLLENAAFRQLIEKYDKEDIKFWRTTSQREVDFIVQNKLAFEVKSDAKKIKKENHSAFLEKYPDMKFEIISLNSKNEINSSTNSHPVIDVWKV